MAELSVEEVSALARKFLVGQADVESGAKLQQVVDDDPTAALELLTQMQDALDHVTPYGLNPDQWKEADGKLAALIQGRAKKPSGSLLSGLFGGAKKSASPKATKVKRRSSSPVLTGKAEKKPSPEKPAEELAPAEASGTEEGGGIGPKVLVLFLVATALAGGAYWRFFMKPKPQPVKKAAALPAPSPSPTPDLRARRGLPLKPLKDVAIPAEIPPATPRPAGMLDRN